MDLYEPKDSTALWYKIDVDKTLQLLKSSERGLSAKEAEARLRKHGFNEIKERKRTTVLEVVIQQFKNFLILLLIAAALISAGIGVWQGSIQEIIEACLIMLIVLFIVLVGFYQEYNAEKELEALRQILTPIAVVERGGQKQKIPARQLVPGDIIHLEAGDRVPADARLLEAIHLKVDESLLTGEAQPVEKDVQTLLQDANQGDRSNMVYMGTTITYGKGKAVVVATGMNSNFGRIANSIQEIKEEKTPLQERLDVLGKQIGIGVILLCTLVFLTGILTQHIQLSEMFLIAVALAVAAVPEGLPGVVTITLAMGTRRMVARNVIVRRLPAVETLGSTTVICSDKTGTITHNEMTVKKIYVAGEMIDVAGEGFVPEGVFTREGKELNAKDNPELLRLLSAAALCNNATLRKEDGTWRFTGDPTEISLVVAATKAGLRSDDLSKGQPRTGEIPFDSKRKRMATIHQCGELFTVYVKGAPEVLLEFCSYISINNNIRRLSAEDKEKILEINKNLGGGAFRVLAVAYKTSTEKVPEEEAERELIFLGLIAMKDPPRQGVREAIEKCQEAGVRTVMITGDYQGTAVAVAREIGLTDGHGNVITGAELASLSDDEFENRVDKIAIYARVNPEHKLRIVSALKKRGHVVAMTGDGVNDAPALKKADIGVAMGITGTDVSREASDMVLTDDNFASIVGAIEEGRGIYDNIKKFFAYLISGNIAEVVIVFVTSIWAAVPIALTATQILIINLVTDGLPALALGVDPFEPNAMRRPPRSRKEPLHDGLAPFIYYYPMIVICVVLGLFYWVYDPAVKNVFEAQTVAFLTIAFSEMYQAFAVRSTRYPSLKVGLFANPWLVLAVASSLIVCVGLVYIPVTLPFLGVSLREILHLVPLSPQLLLTVVLLSSLGFIYLEIAKALASRKGE